MSSIESNGIDPGETPLASKNSDPHILDYFTLLARHRKVVVFTSVLVAGVLLLFSFLEPQTFSSETTILPPEKQGGVGGLMSFLAGSSALDLMKAQENPAVDLFKNILDSRMLSSEVIADPRISRYLGTFDTSRMGKLGMVHDAMESDALRNGMMTVTVELPTHWLPKRQEIDTVERLSAYIANSYVRALDKFNRERLMTTARNTRIFIEAAYGNHMRELDSIYRAYQSFQELHKAISLPEQLASTVQSAAKLAASAQQLEIEIGVEERELNPNSNRVATLKAQLEEANEELKKYDEGTEGEYAIALQSVPALSRQVAGYLREIKLLEQVTGYLRQELEQERIDEQKDLPSLQVLDSAVVPTKKSSPKRLTVLLVGLMAGFAISLLYVSIHTYFERVQRNPEEHIHFLNFARAIRFGVRSPVDASGGQITANTVLRMKADKPKLDKSS